MNALIESIISFNKFIDKSVGNNEISKAVKRLLSSLQSISKRHSNENSFAIQRNRSFDEQLIKCLSKLENIIFNEKSFAETSVLSGLAFAFVLSFSLSDIKKSIHLFLKLFSKQSIVFIDFNNYEIDNTLSEVLDKCETNNDLTKVSLLSALLNCTHFIDYLICFESKVFIQIHCHIIKVCNQRLVHQFHVFRLLQHYFRTFKNYIKEITEKEPNILDDKSLITSTLDQIDNNWEHPINGVKDCVKIIYNLVLEVIYIFANNSINGLIYEQLVNTTQLSFTSKAKYRKLSALIQFVKWRPVLQLDPNLCSQMFKYLSINSLSTAIIELYKSLVISMKSDTNEDIVTNWSNHWLPHICCALKSKNKVIHNNMIAHILPFTLNNIDNSSQLIFANIEQSSIAEVALVRSSIDSNLTITFLPPFSWIKKILVHNEEIVREEGLTLLIDERYITDRNKVFELFKWFLLSNLNVDNPSFRQRIVSKIEQFLTKISISLCDKYVLYQSYDESDNNSIRFLNEYTDIITSNLTPGASYQRRTTCLLLLESLLTIKHKYDLHFEIGLNLDSIHSLILLTIIDKDDKVRKMATNLLITFHKYYQNSINYNFEIIAEIGLKLLNSPRHQESHSGALIFKYIINCFHTFTINGKQLCTQLEMIEFLVKSAQTQYKSSELNFLNSAKYSPIHGFILALNNCLTSDCLLSYIEENEFKLLINDSIILCFNCIDLMLSQLSQTSVESSPSFQEMCESLESIITKQMDKTEREYFDDISTSNEFQLLLSMCWLNIKECSFLLSNLVEFTEKLNQNIISDSVLHEIGSQVINILIKCRHKGVIEATCIALTRYTASLIRMNSRNIKHIQVLKDLLEDSLNCITKSALTSSITRRSAGVALTIQAILIGESDAHSQGFKPDVSLFSQTIDELIKIANFEIPETIDDKSDLPQTYALHILKSIISTASLSRFTVSTVELLLPICIKGFSANVWQIRNASLQLFGSCGCRMLGQRKLSDVDHTLSEGSTITSTELFSRYPTLLSAFKLQFEESFKKIVNGSICSELVPILSLFSSFSPICFSNVCNDEQLIAYLIRLLGNKVWKIRMLSAKALSNLLTIHDLQNVLLELCKQQNLNCNSIHGLMLAVNHLIELKEQMKVNDKQIIKHKFSAIFEKFIDNNKKCYVLRDIFNELFGNKFIETDSCGQELEDNSTTITSILSNDNFIEFLDEIYANVEFSKSDDIRLFAAKTLNNKISELIEKYNSTHCHQIVFKLIDILLIILEDEDRNVRLEAEIITSNLINLYTNTSVMSFYVAIDNLLIWLIEKSLINGNKLTDFLISKLESVISLSQIIELQKQNEILFEKEEKNVFAEPLFQLFKVFECLKILITRKSITINTINTKSFTKLVNDCRYCLRHKSIFEFKNLVLFSIWKLPKLFVCISSLYLRIELILHLISVNSNETHISSIIGSFNEIHISSDKCIENNLIKIFSKEEVEVLLDTIKLLSSKFSFLSIIRQNILSGHSLVNCQT